MINFNTGYGSISNPPIRKKRERSCSAKVAFKGYQKTEIGDNLLTPLLEKALSFAQKHHEGQYRKHPTDKIPFFNHVHNVGVRMKKMGFSDEEASAGVLHDIVEDTKVGYDGLREHFGEKIANFVDEVTEQIKEGPWKVRKDAYYERIKDRSPVAKVIAALDKVDSMECDLEAYSEFGRIPFKTSKGGIGENIANRDKLLSVLNCSEIPHKDKVLDIYTKTLDKVKKACSVKV